jgi:hypothetical protein
MTKKMEEFFNLPPSDEPEVEDLPTKTREELMIEAREIYSALSTAEKVDIALPTVVGLDTHDTEMDDIASKAVRTFNDLIALGGNVPDMHAAKNAKAERKLKMIDLQLKKVRAEQIDIDQGNGNRKLAGGGEFDRNELLKYIVSNKIENSDK